MEDEDNEKTGEREIGEEETVKGKEKRRRNAWKRRTYKRKH